MKNPAGRVLPGVLLCAGITLLAAILQMIEQRLTGHAYVEALVLAILAGVALRTAWRPGEIFLPGIEFSAKLLLEIAVMLLGASVSAATVLDLGPAMLLGIAAIVAVSLCASYGISRALGLKRRLAILVACGNSICGNSAIAAVAPVIGADGEDVASSVSFTAVLGVAVVLVLPLLSPLLELSVRQYGVLAGLTVYAVPQVLAATLPIGALANQVGTVVKLVRVLMLGPVVLALSPVTSRLREEPDEDAPHLTAGDRPKPGLPALHQLVPWFILGFLAMAGLRSFGLIPASLLAPVIALAAVLTTISMAALGLGVELGVVARAGIRVSAAVTLSLAVLGAISLGLIRLLAI
jgi:uncharacterized integral membrane protein (TIGR00698 family)